MGSGWWVVVGWVVGTGWSWGVGGVGGVKRKNESQMQKAREFASQF